MKFGIKSKIRKRYQLRSRSRLCAKVDWQESKTVTSLVNNPWPGSTTKRSRHDKLSIHLLQCLSTCKTWSQSLIGFRYYHKILFIAKMPIDPDDQSRARSQLIGNTFPSKVRFAEFEAYRRTRNLKCDQTQLSDLWKSMSRGSVSWAGMGTLRNPITPAMRPSRIFSSFSRR